MTPGHLHLDKIQAATGRALGIHLKDIFPQASTTSQADQHTPLIRRISKTSSISNDGVCEALKIALVGIEVTARSLTDRDGRCMHELQRKNSLDLFLTQLFLPAFRNST